MRRTLYAAALVAGITLTPTQALASPDWVPDHLEVKPVPAAYAVESIGLPEGLDAQPGDILDVIWEKRDRRYIAHVGDVEFGDDWTVDASTVPTGPDSAQGTVYPSYEVPMEVDADHESLLRVLDRDPRTDGAHEVASPPMDGDLVWVSEQTVKHEATQWVRVGYGVQDAWIPTGVLVPADLTDKVGTDECLPDSAACGDPAAEPSATPEPVRTDEPDAATPAEHDTFPWWPVGALGAAAVAGSVWWSRRPHAGTGVPTDEAGDR